MAAASKKNQQQSVKSKEIAHRRDKVATMYLRGHTQQAIADECDVSVGTINRDLQELNKKWVASADAAVDERKAKELAKLDALEAQAWESFFSSMKTVEKGQGKRKTPAQKRGAKPKESLSQFVKEIESAGDPRFLNIVENCIERRCRIIGIDAPGKVELTGKGGGPIEYKDRSNMAITALADMLRSSGVGLQDQEEDEPDENFNARSDDD